MSYVIKFFYSFLFPPGIYIVALVALTCYFFWMKKRIPAILLSVVSLVFYLSSCNFVGYALVDRIGSQYEFPSSISGDCILVLGEGASLEVPSVDGQGELNGDMALNVIAALKLYNRLHVPIILSGGVGISGNGAGNEAQLSKRDLVQMQVPKDMIIVEDKSRTTMENAQFSAKILQEKGYKKPVLVTTSPHMPRSVELFRQEGIEVIPLPTRFTPPQAHHYNYFDFLPSSTGVFMVQQSLKETLGRLQQFLM